MYFSETVELDLVKLAAPLAFVNACNIGTFTVAVVVAGSFSVQELAALGFTMTLIVTTVVFFFMLSLSPVSAFEVVPEQIHQRSPMFVGSSKMVRELQEFLEDRAPVYRNGPRDEL